MPQASIKLKFRPSTSKDKEGTLYLQLIRNREVKQVRLGYHLYNSEWDSESGEIALVSPSSESRNEILNSIRNKVDWEIRKLNVIISKCENTSTDANLDKIAEQYYNLKAGPITVFDFMKKQIERLKRLGKHRTSETYTSTLNSLMRFRSNVDLFFDMIDGDMAEMFEAHLRARHISRNTSSFYMRILRAVYNQAVEEGLTKQAEPFRKVYTGVDKTTKRAISIKDIKRLKNLDLTGDAGLDFARDMFLFSFYMRGMSFIDMAYLRKKDLKDDYVVYSRQKTRQQLSIHWEPKMQDLLDKYDTKSFPYLLPIIKGDVDELEARRQYINKEQFVNRKLKLIGKKLNFGTKLTMYVARHSWASIAQNKNIPLSVISQGMGHDSELTTQIYLASIQTAKIDKANNDILKEL